MTTIKSEVTGLDIWAYDMTRRAGNQIDRKDDPVLNAYAESYLTKAYTIIPVTQQPKEYLDVALNYFRTVCDTNHVSDGSNILTHGIISTSNSNIDQFISPATESSSRTFMNYKFIEDADINFKPSTTGTGTKPQSKQAFTTSTHGIKIITQTGIVPISTGYGVIVFELEAGYTIPVGTTIKMTPNVNGEPTTPVNYIVNYEMKAGNYLLTTENLNNWEHGDVDFATVPVAPIPVPTPITTIAYFQKLDAAKSNVTGSSISRKLNAISLTADDGNIFQTNISVLFYSDGDIASRYYVSGNGQSSITIPLNTTSENMITDDMDKVALNASATPAPKPTPDPTTPTTQTGGYEHNYLITDTELSSFSNDTILTFLNSTEGVEKYDITKFINNLIELPFKVDTPTTMEAISVGTTKSHVLANETKNRFVTLDLGTINVPPKYNNGYDYQNKTVKLYTPFVAPITINNENVIDKIIHIVYEIDISNGDLTVNLYNDNVLFFTGTHNIASELPFLNDSKNNIIKRDTHFNDNDIRKPYLVVTRETPILDNDYYPTIERGSIKNYVGNVKVRLLNNMNIPNNELSELTSQLENGVKYVKSD